VSSGGMTTILAQDVLVPDAPSVPYTFESKASNTPPDIPFSPSPGHHASGVSVDADLSWTGGDPDAGDTVTYDVYCDTMGAATLVSNDQSPTTYDSGTLSYNTTYHWKVVATDNHGVTTEGPVWDFTTAGEWDPWVYDENKDDIIQKIEAIHAIQEYFDGRITKALAIEVVQLYFSYDELPTPLTSGVDSICALGVPGPLLAVNSIPIPIVTGDDDTTPDPSVVVMASGSGDGRVVALGHEGFLTNEGLELFDNRQFGNNIVDWLDKSGKRKILVTTGHSEWYGGSNFDDFKAELQGRGYTVTRFPGTITPSVLSDAGVVLIGTAWGNVLSSEIDALTNFVTDGGGLFLTGLGWSWKGHKGPLDDYPMNKVAEPYGIRWIDGYISDPTDAYEGQPIFHTFYPDAD